MGSIQAARDKFMREKSVRSMRRIWERLLEAIVANVSRWTET